MILLHSTFLAIVLVQSSDWNERQWSDHLAQQLRGTSEVRLADDSRCDILTDDYVYEVEWADNGRKLHRKLFFTVVSQIENRQ